MDAIKTPLSCTLARALLNIASLSEVIRCTSAVTRWGWNRMAERQATRKLRLFLRDFRMVEASVNLAEGQALSSWLANRKHYVNLQGALWAGTTEVVRHAALKIDQVLWATSIENDVPLTPAASSVAPRSVGIQLEGGLLLRCGLNIGERQRLSDYLESTSQFIPVRGALLLRSGRSSKEVNLTLGDVVLNQQAIQAVWELAAQVPDEAIEERVAQGVS